MRRGAPLALLLAFALCPASAEAHLNSTGMGPLYDGAVHFLESPGDLLCALALALFGGLRGPDSARRVLFVLPSAWLIAALASSLTPAVAENALAEALWVLGLGALLALDAKLSPRAVSALAACTGAYHGLLDGSGLGWSASTLGAGIGMAAAVFALAALASAGVVAIRFDWGRIAVRVAGSWLAASGLLWLGWAARSPG